MNIMNKANTLGNKMWTPEYQQQIEQQQQSQQLDELEDIVDPYKNAPENKHYYRPQAMGFTQADNIATNAPQPNSF